MRLRILKSNCRLRSRFFMPVAALVALASVPMHAGEQDAQLVQATAQQTVIAFKLTSLRFDTVTASQGNFALRPSFTEAISRDEPGAPDLPVRVFVLAVPTDARVEVNASSGRVEEISNVAVAPIPTYNKDNSSPAFKFDPNIFGQNAFFPAKIARAAPIGQLRQQRVVRIEVSPLQYNPATKSLRIHHEMQIVVRHAGSVQSLLAALPASQVEEAFYRSLIFNYEQARSFREPRPARLSKTQAPYANGPLYKFAVNKEGFYRVTGATLAAKGAAGVAVNDIRLYNNGGRELPRGLNAPRPLGLVENAILVFDAGNDGRLDANDYILFYGKGVDGFAYDSTSGNAFHYLNRYGFDNYYWLCVAPATDGSSGKRMKTRTPQPPGSAGTPVTTFQDYLFVEEELNVLFESSQSWFGFMFTNTQGTNSRRYRVQLTDPLTESTASLKLVVYAPFFSGPNPRISLTFNGQPRDAFSFSGNNSSRQTFERQFVGSLQNGENEIVVGYTGSGDVARMYMDYFELKYERQLRMPGPLLFFEGKTGANPVAYRLNNVNAQELMLFEVSNFSEVTQLTPENWQVSGTQVTFADVPGTRVPRRYAAVTSTGLTEIPSAGISVENPSNWRSPEHAADMIIITHSDFTSQAERLKSLRENWHGNGSLQQMAVEIVNIQDVFDEFSCGLYDPAAVRDFLKYTYENWQRPPVFVVLFGDGDYDPKNLINKTDKNWIPTYHTAELDEYASRVTDSWFTYINGENTVMDMAIGRIPVRTLTEAQAYMDKLIKYETAPVFGPWRNTIIMVADDEYGEGSVPSSSEATHINDTERLIREQTPDYFDIKKLYLTEFASEQSASISGIRKPAGTDAFIRLLNAGALIVNYTGHGNPSVLSHERLLELSSDFDLIRNGDRQAVWVAATCTFGKFDLPDRQSFAEMLLLEPGHGAIAALATTRDVFSTPNARLNQAYYEQLFLDNQISEQLGVALMKARMETNTTTNDEKFHLYGDPSMRLAIPRYTAQLATPDTIKALAVMRVRGTVLQNGQQALNYNGKVRLEAFDTQRRVSYRSPGNFNIVYNLPGNSLFRGEAPVTNGNFEVQFIAPKDLTYGGTNGRYTVYFWNDSTDGNGYRENLSVGGSATGVVDAAGPEIQIGFQGVENFVSGGYVATQPVLHVVLKDSISGINIAGEIGHKITLTLDGNTGNKIDVTDFFSYESGSFTRGALFYQLDGLGEGRHTLEVKAWDNSNNSGTGSAEFVIADQGQLALREVMNYPNPLRNETSFTFEINQPTATVEIKIYTLAGRLIRRLEPVQAVSGFNMIAWDGRDGDGDQLANGVYLYKVIANMKSAENGGDLRAEEIGKVVVQR